MTSIPDWGRLWDTYKDQPAATSEVERATMASAGHSSGPEPLRRAQHLTHLNQALRDVCVAKAPRCVFDGNALYAWSFTLGDFSGQDYFHFSQQGQGHVADLDVPDRRRRRDAAAGSAAHRDAATAAGGRATPATSDRPPVPRRP